MTLCKYDNGTRQEYRETVTINNITYGLKTKQEGNTLEHIARKRLKDWDRYISILDCLGISGADWNENEGFMIINYTIVKGIEYALCKVVLQLDENNKWNTTKCYSKQIKNRRFIALYCCHFFYDGGCYLKDNRSENCFMTRKPESDEFRNIEHIKNRENEEEKERISSKEIYRQNCIDREKEIQRRDREDRLERERNNIADINHRVRMEQSRNGEDPLYGKTAMEIEAMFNAADLNYRIKREEERRRRL